MARLADKRIGRAHVTLHVGAGTFLPVNVENTKDHVMHAEWAELSPETAEMLNRARAAGGRIVGGGAPALRPLENATDHRGPLHAFSRATPPLITPCYPLQNLGVP